MGKRLLLGAMMVGVLAAGIVYAAPINIIFSGHITSATDPTWIGLPITGTGNFDPDTALHRITSATEDEIWSHTGSNTNAPGEAWMHVTANFAGQTFQNNMPNPFLDFGQAWVRDGYGTTTFNDLYLPLYVRQKSDNDGTRLYNFLIYAQNWGTLADVSPGGSLDLTSGLSLTQPIDLARANERVGVVTVVDPNGPNYDVSFRLDSVQAANVQVPEPATLALVGLGLAGLAASRRRSVARSAKRRRE